MVNTPHKMMINNVDDDHRDSDHVSQRIDSFGLPLAASNH